MLVQVPVMFQLNQSTLNKLYFLLFSLFFLQSCNESQEDKNLPVYKEWIYDIELMLNDIYKDRDEDSELPVQGGTDISKIVALVNTMYDNRMNQNTNETTA